MKTLHITNAYHGTSGGIRTFYHALLDGANRARREVVLIVPGAREEMREVGAYGRVYSVPAPRAPLFDRRYRLILPTHYFPMTRRTVVGLLERERADVVEVCDKYSLPYLAGMLRKAWHPRVPRPTLVGLSCERFDDNMAAYLSRSSAAHAFTRWYIRNIYGPPFDFHVANSNYTAEELRTAMPERAAGFIRVCSMGVDVDAFDPSRRSVDMRERLLRHAGGGADSVLVFYAGRLSPEKNLELLVDTLRKLATDGARDYRLVVAGDGPRAQWLRNQATGSLHGRIFLSGNLDRETLAICCASCDVFLHPNPREPFGIGPLEAMASGVPVVAPAAGGVLEYANVGNSWLAPPDAGAFASAVRHAATFGDAGKLRAALASARAFGWEEATRRYFDLYDELHDRRRHGSRNTTSTPRLEPAVAGA